MSNFGQYPDQQSPVSPSDPGPYQLDGQEVAFLSSQVQKGDFSGICNFIAESLSTGDWDDRYFVVNKVSQSVNQDALNSACASAPSDAGLHLLLGAYYFYMAIKSRGARQVEETTEDQFETAIRYTEACCSCLSHVASLEPGDPTPHAIMSRALTISSDFEKKRVAAYQAGDRIAPHFVTLQSIEVNARSRKWGGSHQECLDTARAALRKGKPGDDMGSCLFFAHFLVYQYAWAFEKDASRAAAYLLKPQVIAELNPVFDRWTDSTYRAHRSSSRYLHQAAIWYFKTGDHLRLRRCLELTNNQPHEETWAQLGGVQKKFAEALQMAYSFSAPKPASPPKKGLFSFLKKKL